MTEPLALELPVAGKPVTVFGGDGPAVGMIARLRDAGARVTVVAARASATVSDLASRGVLTWKARMYEVSDLHDARLVVAATGDRALDSQIAKDAEDRGLWCVETGDGPEVGDRSEVRGSVTLVGGGPGDPGLITLAGLDAVRRADVVVTDRLAPLAALSEVRAGTLVIDVAKVPGGEATPQQEINRLLIDHASAGRHVVRLKGGDAFLFGRGGEELQACTAAAVDVHVIPGVTSALAVPAVANIPMTHRGLNQGFTVVSGHVPPGDPRSTVDYGALARSGTSLVFLMAARTLPAIADALLDAGLDPDTPAATVADGTLPSQRSVRATVATIAAKVATAGLRAPTVTVVGSVAGFDPLGRDGG